VLHSLTQKSSSTNRKLRDVERAHPLHVLGEATAARPVGLAHDVVDERLPRGGALEVPAAPHQQRLLEGTFEGAVGRLDVAVLLLRGDLGRARLHAEVPHDREVVLVERALAAALADGGLAVRDPVRGRGGVVRLVPLGHASELEESALHAVSNRRDRLGQADARPTPVGVRQHEHAQHVHEQLPRDRHRELGRPREVRLRGLAWAVQLCEHHVLVRATLGAPGLHTALERPQLPFLVASRILPHQHLEQCLGLQRRRLDQHRLQLWPVLEERILVRPPVTRLDQLRRQFAATHVLARGLPIHAGSHRREADTAVLRHLFHQLPHLRVRRPHRPHGPLSRTMATVDRRASGWGDVTVVHRGDVTVAQQKLARPNISSSRSRRWCAACQSQCRNKEPVGLSTR